MSKYLLMPLAAIPVLVFGVSQENTNPVLATIAMILPIILLLGWPILVIRLWLRNRRGTKLGRLLRNCLAGLAPLSIDQYNELCQAIADPRITPNDRDYQCMSSYLEVLRAIVEDRTITEKELVLLTQIEKLYGLDPEFCRETKIEVFR